MKIKRSSWHYKVRKKYFIYNGWEIIIEKRVTDVEKWSYIEDVIYAILSGFLWRKGKREKIEFID